MSVYIPREPLAFAFVCKLAVPLYAVVVTLALIPANEAHPVVFVSNDGLVTRFVRVMPGTHVAVLVELLVVPFHVWLTNANPLYGSATVPSKYGSTDEPVSSSAPSQ
jgi:hypothetical protein